jgi:hypothetical protein
MRAKTSEDCSGQHSKCNIFGKQRCNSRDVDGICVDSVSEARFSAREVARWREGGNV